MIPYVEIPNVCWPAIANLLTKRFEEDKADRRFQEELWLHDARQYRGILEPEEEKIIQVRGWGSRAFLRSTRIKVKTNDAKINDIAFNANRQNWKLTPTENPDLAINLPAKEADAEADVKMQAMDRVMRDDVNESGYNQLGRDVTHSGHRYGTGILKGPLPIEEVQHRWIQDQGTGQWQPSEATRRKMYIEFVSVWDFYPDISARSMSNIDHSFQRHIMSFGEAAALADRTDMDGDAIMEHLGSKPDGDYQRLPWEQRLSMQDKTNERQLPQSNRRYEVLEFWGVIDSKVLVDAMESASQPLPPGWEEMPAAIEITVWLFPTSKKVFKACFNPFDRQTRPYSFYIPDPEDGQVFGNSIPYLMRDTQELKNGTVRSAMDNIAASSGWQADVDKSRLVDEDSLLDLSPFQVHLTKSDSWNAGQPAIRFYQPQVNVSQYVQMLSVLDRYDDEASGSPAYQYGQSAQGAGRTARGLGMLMGNADLLMLEQNNQVDAFQRSFLTMAFDWEMQFNDNEDIKGDYHVHVVPSQAQSLKDDLSQKLDNFALTTVDPLDAPWVHRRRLLQKRAEAMGIKWEDVMYTDKELDAKTADIAGGGGPPAGGEPPGGPAPGDPQAENPQGQQVGSAPPEPPGPQDQASAMPSPVHSVSPTGLPPMPSPGGAAAPAGGGHV